MTPIAKNPTTDAEKAIALTASIQPREVDGRDFDALVGQAALHPRRDWRLIPAFAIAALAGAVLVLAWPKEKAGTPVELVATAGSTWSQSAGVVKLESGRISVGRAGGVTVRLETPHVSLEARHSRFLAEVVASGTSLIVEEGEVVLRAGAVTRVVKAGESLVWPPTPEIPSSLLESNAPSAPKCDEVSDRHACLENEAKGSTLDAQAALFELGTLESLDESLRRFPDGVLHPEVRLRRLVLLVKARRFDEARAAARDFELACPTDARLAEVRALRGSLR
ncbi:MAG: hypothetical protein ACO1OB_03690 [Archangium sp.]